MKGMKKLKKLSQMMIEIGGTVQKDRDLEEAKEGWIGPVSRFLEG
jgi:hypothetical protein